MSEFLEGLFMAKEIFTVMLIVVFTVVYSYAVTYLLRTRKERHKKNKKKFFTTLLEGLKGGTVERIDDLFNIYKGVFELATDDLNYQYMLNKRLREFLVALISKEIDPSLESALILKWKEKVSEFIKINDDKMPYSNLPQVERGILSDIWEFANSNNRQAIRSKLVELADAIQIRNENFVKISGINKWSVPLSVTGMCLTIIFGLIAIFK